MKRNTKGAFTPITTIFTALGVAVITVVSRLIIEMLT